MHSRRITTRLQFSGLLILAALHFHGYVVAAEPAVAEVVTTGETESPAAETSPGAWEKTKEASGDAWDATREGSAAAWEKTKEVSGVAWDATREGSAAAWKKTRELTQGEGEEAAPTPQPELQSP